MFRIIELPAFTAVTSGIDQTFDFSPTGKLGQFDAFFSAIKPLPKDNFMPRDFLYYDESNKGLVWMYALIDGVDTLDYETIDFEGGYYVTFTYQDGDDKTRDSRYQEAMTFINNHNHIELDIRENHYPMGHIITPEELMNKQGYAQMQTYIPVKMK